MFVYKTDLTLNLLIKKDSIFRFRSTTRQSLNSSYGICGILHLKSAKGKGVFDTLTVASFVRIPPMGRVPKKKEIVLAIRGGINFFLFYF